MKRTIEVVCAGILGLGVFFPTSAKAFVSTITNINDQTYTITDSNYKTPLALRCQTCDTGDGGGDGEPSPKPIPPIYTPPPIPTPAVQFLLNHSSLIRQTIQTTWNEAGKGIVAQKIKESLNNRQISNGVNIYKANVDIAGISDQQLTVGSQANLVRLTIVIPGNYTEFRTTTNTIFGSYGDPSFGVSFDLTFYITISVEQLLSPNSINIIELKAVVSNASVHGSNAVGTIVETVGDFIPGVDFSQTVTSKVNQSIDFKNQLETAIKTAVATPLGI